MNCQGQFCPEKSLISTLVCAYLCASHSSICVKGRPVFDVWLMKQQRQLHQAESEP